MVRVIKGNQFYIERYRVSMPDLIDMVNNYEESDDNIEMIHKLNDTISRMFEVSDYITDTYNVNYLECKNFPEFLRPLSIRQITYFQEFLVSLYARNFKGAFSRIKDLINDAPEQKNIVSISECVTLEKMLQLYVIEYEKTRL
jgi:hypothetical protein